MAAMSRRSVTSLVRIWPTTAPAKPKQVATLPILLRRLDGTLQLVHAFGDDLRGFHGRLAQLRVLDDFALDALALALQQIAQTVKLVDQPVDLFERTARNALKQRVDAGRADLAI